MLALAALVWRVASPVVSLAYVVVGGFFAGLPWLVSSPLVTQSGGLPPVLPEPVAVALSDLWFSTTWELNAVGTIGAGMLIAGIAALLRGLRRPRRGAASAEGTPPTAGPSLP